MQVLFFFIKLGTKETQGIDKLIERTGARIFRQKTPPGSRQDRNDLINRMQESESKSSTHRPNSYVNTTQPDSALMRLPNAAKLLSDTVDQIGNCCECFKYEGDPTNRVFSR